MQYMDFVASQEAALISRETRTGNSPAAVPTPGGDFKGLATLEDFSADQCSNKQTIAVIPVMGRNVGRGFNSRRLHQMHPHLPSSGVPVELDEASAD